MESRSYFARSIEDKRAMPSPQLKTFRGLILVITRLALAGLSIRGPAEREETEHGQQGFDQDAVLRKLHGIKKRIGAYLLPRAPALR
jgi:hypothetical protein